ncbi:hypothetical protein SAMD00019534_014070 [Acytostelium subglobosum LB1]|uniref:hypothetical protein n=1 Tax=Acytostelium subglobosum LB1 TaxID=1410327 RepID=UPI000644E3E4|nr:hypothetical protein SAMD00019534_014070 [Acytostelium subglobosum LB1]GAM18232.1 hypothetical protein SAMD00019534_014070 [Acytostelium subglobosum LB1]|eukprot:XP_012758828.1 hypothetical protein SAMD00019534_014070 [Acytostelium subglobosum LB1]
MSSTDITITEIVEQPQSQQQQQQQQNDTLMEPRVNPKYGLPQRLPVHLKVHPKKFFDSADWVLNGSVVDNNSELINPAFESPAYPKVH